MGKKKKVEEEPKIFLFLLFAVSALLMYAGQQLGLLSNYLMHKYLF
jgi:hypothetical protein